MMRKNAGVLIGLLVFGVMLLFVGNADAERVTWTPNQSYTDNTGATGTFTAEEMATMKFTLRAGKSGLTRTPFATTTGGISTWTGDLKTVLGAKPGETWDFTVSQAFTSEDGVERDSAESEVYSYFFPWPPGRTPGIPGSPEITE